MTVGPLIDEIGFRDRFDIDSDIKPTRITPHIGSASRRLRQWVGETVYAQALDYAQNESSELDLAEDLKNAEAHLAMHFAIWGLNSPLSQKGVVATQMAAEGREMRKYLTPDETAKLSAHFLDLAREIASPYCPEEIDAGVEIVELSTDDGEAVTDG